MKRTKTLRLQKPEAGDEYNSNSITQNTQLINSLMGKIGGYTAERTIELSQVLSLNTTDFEYDTTPGRLTVYGNGLAHIEVNVKTKKSIAVDNLGMAQGSAVGNLVVADVFPEFSTAIAQPLTSGGFGPAVTGYIAPNTTRIVFRMLNGYYSGSIPIGTTLQFTGLYPLAEIPSGIGLEQMSTIFDNELHVRNLQKIDQVAAKLKTLKEFSDNSTSVVEASPSTATIGRRILYRNTDGLVSLDLVLNLRATNPGNSSGDLANTTVARITDADWWPDRNTKLISTATGLLINGEINQSGEVSITSYAGRNISINDSFSLSGDWMYRGN